MSKVQNYKKVKNVAGILFPKYIKNKSTQKANLGFHLKMQGWAKAYTWKSNTFGEKSCSLTYQLCDLGQITQSLWNLVKENWNIITYVIIFWALLQSSKYCSVFFKFGNTTPTGDPRGHQGESEATEEKGHIFLAKWTKQQCYILFNFNK